MQTSLSLLHSPSCCLPPPPFSSATPQHTVLFDVFDLSSRGQMLADEVVSQSESVSPSPLLCVLCHSERRTAFFLTPSLAALHSLSPSPGPTLRFVSSKIILLLSTLRGLVIILGKVITSFTVRPSPHYRLWLPDIFSSFYIHDDDTYMHTCIYRD